MPSIWVECARGWPGYSMEYFADNSSDELDVTERVFAMLLELTRLAFLPITDRVRLYPSRLGVVVRMLR